MTIPVNLPEIMAFLDERNRRSPMRPPSLLRLLLTALFAATLIGCGGDRPAAKVDPGKAEEPVAPGTAKPLSSHPEAPPPITRVGDGADPGAAKGDGVVKLLDLPAAAAPALTQAEKYDDALIDALGLMADRKYAEALTALEAARRAQDTEQIRAEIDKVRRLIDQEKAAEKTQSDIQTVLKDGRPDDAAKLAGDALQTYGGTDVAEPLEKLKRQADAVAAAQVDDGRARRERFRAEADAALRDKNLRAASISLEQALQYGDDPSLRTQYDQVRASLARYDDARRRARDLRRDPGRLEDALATLQEASYTWDTPQVRQEIDECSLALQKRRDRISVADFEVRGDVGIPFAGRTLAEELLPAFKARYDLVERGQLGKVMDELRLEASELAGNDEARSQLGRLARLRYLVVGSVTPVNGLLVHARLIEVKTGLVVQTARLVAAGPDDLMRRLPQLAALLQMSDEQRLVFEQALIRQAPEPVRFVETAPLPPPPPAPVVGVVLAPPPPILVYNPRPIPVGGLLIEDFYRLPPPPPPSAPAFGFNLMLVKENPYKRRLLSISVELGDNLFRRGRYQEAHRHFEVALSLSGHSEEVAVRVERCRPYLPPPPPVVVIDTPRPAPVVFVSARPRLAIFNFLVDAPAGLVPIGTDNWCADQLAGCFAPSHEVIDRGEVCWWMGRLGLTMREVLNDPTARVALAQSLNARFFVFGGMRHTASFDVTTHMVDAQTGGKTGEGKIHVQDQGELKLRMQELVGQTTGKPADQARLAQQGAASEQALNQTRQNLQKGNAAAAAEAARAGLKQNPNNVALQSLLARADQQNEKARLEQARRQEAERQKTQVEAARKRQAELTAQAAEARRRAEAEAKAGDEATRRQQEATKQRAYDSLAGRAQAALKAGNPQQAASLYESAVALRPNDAAATRELAQAKAKVEESARARAVAEQARRDEDARKKREADSAAARAKVDDERKQREAQDLARRKEQETRDAAEHARLVDQGRGALAKQDYGQAAAAFATAQRLKKTPEVDKLLLQAQASLARAEAAKKGEAERKAAEVRLAQEKTRRDQADAEAKKKQQAYQDALTAGQKAFAEKRFDQATASYNEAGKLFRTDAVLAGLRQVEDAKKRDTQAKNTADADRKKRLADYQLAMDAGKSALTAKRYEGAVNAFNEALRIMPGDRDATAQLDAAKRARDAQQTTVDADKRRQQDEEKRRTEFARLTAQGQGAMAGKRYDEAVKVYGEALKLMPGDPAVTKALRDAGAALEASRTPPKPAGPPAEFTRQMDLAAANEKVGRYADAVRAYREALKAAPGDVRASKGAEYAQYMADGQSAQAARKYADAVRAFEAALKVVPNHPAAEALLREAQKALDSSRTPPKPPQPPTANDYAKFLVQGQQAMTAKRYADAAKAYAEALRLAPNDAAATKGLREAQDAQKPQPAAMPAEFTRQMDVAAAAEKQDKYADAVLAYKAALKVVPNEVRASKGAEYAQHMADGQKALTARKFADATREFEAALKVVPNHPDALNYLKRARDGK